MGVLETLKDMYSFSTISSFAGKSLTGPSNGTCAKHTARASWMPGSKLPSYLDGSKPGDYGFDPLGLGEVPANLERFREAELLNARWAMLGVALLGRRSGRLVPGKRLRWQPNKLGVGLIFRYL